ncbi:anaerobic sulfite reductase subunit AsrB [Escherichia albertii]|uniref:anaerobic sulfite reductase subunit AsrB n=1 Tax=Escherichia albertii TaxID=208962 RepID=UPI00211A1389|nr:anaerobic sulfite reductase subunit AsrB [Escherichia albertii]UUL27771.1 anaerobic sulfite reductase subunit AsrB [Escherichia albertii]
MSPCTCHNKKQHNLLPVAYRILNITRHTPLEWNFRVSVDFPAKFGQFVEVSLPRTGEAPISISDYGDGWIDLLIRKVGKVTNEIFTLKEGDNLWLRGCYGNGYPIDAFRHKPLLIIAGGTGVAPVKGLMRYFVENPDEITHMDMILGYKNRDCVLYKDEMEGWDNIHNLILTLDEGEADERYHIGRVTDRLAELTLRRTDNMQAIVVGPPVMIKFTVQMLLQKGLRPEQIWVDYERRMACSVGKCGHCRMGDVYVCVDGPVFNYDIARKFAD